MIVQFQVLNKIIKTRDPSIITYRGLTDEFFSDCPAEFNYIKAHLNRYGNVPDEATFVAAFPKFPIMDVQESDQYLLENLYKDKNKRALTKTFNMIGAAINEGDVDEAMRVYEDSLDLLAQSRYVESVDIYQDISRYDEYVDKVDNKDKYYVTTGFPELDKILGGWDRKNEYVTIIARPGQSKTFNLLKMCTAAAEQGLTVGLYEGEMEVSKVSYRIDTILSGISNSALTKGYDGKKETYREFLSREGANLKGAIKVLTPSMVGGRVGVGTLRSFIEKDHLDMLCVDQHSLLEDDRGGKGPIERAANISKDLKQLQVMTEIPILTVSQQNRTETGKDGATTSNVAQSDRIGQDSTVVIGLEKDHDVLTMRIIKSRDGGDGAVLKYAVDLDHGVFNYMPSERDGAPDSKEACEEQRDEFEYSPEELKKKVERKIEQKKLQQVVEEDEDGLPW